MEYRLAPPDELMPNRLPDESKARSVMVALPALNEPMTLTNPVAGLMASKLWPETPPVEP